LAGVLQIARIDRRIGAKAKLHRTWLATSCSERQLTRKQWLDLEQQRWGIENRTHHTLDVTHREDESRVRQPNAASVLGIFRRLSNAFKQLWAEGRPKREATSRDWVEENHFNRWRGIRLITQTTCSNPSQRTLKFFNGSTRGSSLAAEAVSGSWTRQGPDVLLS